MTGKEAIIKKIISDARIKANSSLEEGGIKAKEILDVARNDARIFKEKNMTESYLEREEIICRKKTIADIESRKIILNAKKTLINEAFAKAIVAIKNDREAYLRLIESMLKEASDGDVVTISESDKKVVTEEFIESVAEKLGKKLTLSKTYGNFTGGVVLTNNGLDKNMTLETELSLVRDLCEPEVAKIIFGE